MEDTAKKVSCLLKDSVTYGAEVYRRIIGEKDVEGRIFNTKIQLLPDALQVQKFEALLNQAIATNQELIMFIDPFQLMRVAKEDVKLAEALFRQGQKKMLLWKQQTAAQNQQATIEGQIKSAQAAEEEKRETETIKIDGDIRRSQIAGQSANQTAVLNMATALLTKAQEGGGKIPQELQPLIDAVVQNVMVGAVASSEEQKQQIIQQIQAAKAQQEQQMQQQNMGAEQPEQQPMPQAAA